MEREKFSISYEKYIQDIAGNVLDVKTTFNSYDPVADKLVNEITDKVIKEEVADNSTAFSFKYSAEIGNQLHAVPMVAKINSINPAEFNIPKPELVKTTYDA
jgi:hypothetical protein